MQPIEVLQEDFAQTLAFIDKCDSHMFTVRNWALFNQDLSVRIDRYLAAPGSPDLLAGYSHSFGRKLKYPSVVRVFSILGNLNRWHILGFYALLAIFSAATPLIAGFFA